MKRKALISYLLLSTERKVSEASMRAPHNMVDRAKGDRREIAVDDLVLALYIHE
jgi:hypothetical protein